MDHNLVPPFILREAGLEVHDTPKIQVTDPTVEDHTIYFPNDDVRIALSLNGIFSYFPSRTPTRQELDTADVLVLTPEGSTWNPHDSAYADNEENMLDWRGDMVEPKDRDRIVLEELPDDERMLSSAKVSLEENVAIDAVSSAADAVCKRAHISSLISPILDPVLLSEALEERAAAGRFAMSVGSTNACFDEYLFDEIEDRGEKPFRLQGSSKTMDLLRVHKDLDSYEQNFYAGAAHAEPPKGVSAQYLSKIWKIDLDSAKKTLNVTTQKCKRADDPSLSRNYSTNDRMLRYKRINQYFFMDTFFATKKAGKSSRGNTCCQLFVSDKGFVYVVPMKSKSEVPAALKMFAKEIGAPDVIVCDNGGEQKSKAVKKFCYQIGTTLRYLEESTPWSNAAELYIGLMKESTRKDMKASDCPLVFWDYCMERRARVNNLTAKNLFQLEGQTPHFTVTGEEGDISNLCQYDWYQWCYYREQGAAFPMHREVLGRVLGPAKGEGNEMAQWILKSNGNVVPRRSLRPLTVSETASETEQKKRETFTALITTRHGGSVPRRPNAKESDDDSDDDDDYVDNYLQEYGDDDESPRFIPEIADPVDAAGNAINQQPLYDQLIHAELILPQGEAMQMAKVLRRHVGPEGKVIGEYNETPIWNSIVYDVEFPDGEIKEYAANQIAENMLGQVDNEGFTLCMVDAIIDHAKDGHAVEKEDQYAVTKRGQRRLRKTTHGWKLLVRWKDGSTTWVPLKDMKESHPIESSEYAKSQNIHTEPAFVWWVAHTLKKRDVIISSVRTRLKRTTHKYGHEVPNNLEHARKIDLKNGNNFWQQAIEKEMLNVGIAFEILQDDEHTPVGWKLVTGHVIFDVKMDFTRKARWVLDGHKTAEPIISTYAGVVSRESVRIALTYASLNGVDVMAADIRNAYLQAPSSQKDYIVCGPEFGLENMGKRAKIIRALYGGKTAGRDFRNHLRSCMKHLGFVSCKADPDVWIRAAKKDDGSEYYEYVLIYTDDVLVVSEHGENFLRNQLGKYFEIKEESIGAPKIYLGGRLSKVTLVNGQECWGFSSSQYVQESVKNLEETLEKQGLKLPARANTPLTSSYRPEIDVSGELQPNQASDYQSYIGILRWMVELGRVDICCEVSMMLSHLALPREGHLQELYHMFAYLKKYHNSEMVFDPSEPDIDESQFQEKDWTTSEFGDCTEEELPANMPMPRGLGFRMRAYVDADHAGDSITRRSRTGFLVYLNKAPIYWMSKKQTSVETSSFGSEFIAMKQCTEYIRGLRYKLRMMGIPCDECSYVYGDNQSVLYNTTIPESTLKKKSQSIAYHFVREGAARNEWRTAYVNTHLNVADLLTKTLPFGAKRSGFVKMVLHHIFGDMD